MQVHQWQVLSFAALFRVQGCHVLSFAAFHQSWHAVQVCAEKDKRKHEQKKHDSRVHLRSHSEFCNPIQRFFNNISSWGASADVPVMDATKLLSGPIVSFR